MTRRAPVFEPLEVRRHLAAQPYDWRNVTIKGTGFVNGIVFSPAQRDLVYANTDMGGAYRWDASAGRWVSMTDWAQSTDWSLNYMGVESLAADPTDANRVYLAMGTSYGFGGNDSAMLRSTDQGRTWLRTNVSFPINGNGPGRSGAQRLHVDPNSPNVLYYGTRNAGIWKSADYGAAWSKLGGFTFTTDSSGPAQNTGVVWTWIDKSSATPGTPSPVIYAGAATTGDAKVYRSLDGGTTWNPLPGQPTGSFYCNGAALSADGNSLYLTYAVGDVGPNNVSNGYAYKVVNPKSATPTWTQLTIDTPHGMGGWGSIAIDPNDPNRLYASTLDRWWPAPYEQLYRSTNGGSTWTALDPGYHRDDSSSGWSSTTNLHWMLDVEIDPFNSNRVMFTTGFGLFSSANATAATPNWSFFNDGLEQSAVLELASPATGPVNLFSAIGDQDGFRHADFSVSPPKLGQANGLHVGTNQDIDVAWSNANYLVRLTGASPYVQYSNDNGVNWAWMPSSGLSSASGGNLAMSADGTRVVYEQGGIGRVVYATRTGSTWSSWATPNATNRPVDGAKIVADLVASQTFYAYQNTTVWRSTDGGANWTVMTTAAPTGAMWIRAVQGNAGHLLMTRGGNGLWRSIDGGASWTRINSAAVTAANEVGVGAAAPGQTYPAIFIGGIVNGVGGFHRSDDQGATWTTISDLAHQYGDVTVIQGDPRVYGRLYVGANGRGVLYADIHNAPPSLPAGWTTQDIGAVGSPGAAGTAGGGAWEVIGGGSGIGGTSDSFRFAYTQLTGDGAITARVAGVPLAGPGNNDAKAGVMIREALSANSRSAFVALTPGSEVGVLFQSRGSVGGATTTASHTLGVWPPYWVRLVRAGNTFTAYRSADGVTWTQLGAPQVIAMGATVQVGLASTASDANNVNIATFDNVAFAPAAPASLAIAPVSPDPRQSGVSTMTFAFDRAVPGFALGDIQVTRAGEIVSLAGASLASGDGGVTWTLSNLAAATSRVGNYVVTVAAAGGAALAAPVSESWVMNLLIGTAAGEAIKLVAAGGGGGGGSVSYFRDEVLQYTFAPAAIGTLFFDGGGGTDAFVLDGSGVAVTLASTQKLASLTIVNGASLDVRDHDIIIDYEDGAGSPIGSWNGSAYTGIAGLIASAFNFHAWDGPGLGTSEPAARQARTTLGVREASEVLFLSGTETANWDGVVVDATSVIVKYTYAGDLNLDGLVDGADYGVIDNYVQFPGTDGYGNGDFNYDGVIDGADYGIIDNTIQFQGPRL